MYKEDIQEGMARYGSGGVLGEWSSVYQTLDIGNVL